MVRGNRRKIPTAWLMRDIRRLLLWPSGPGLRVHQSVLNVKALSVTGDNGSFVVSLRSSGIVRVSYWTQTSHRYPGDEVMTLVERLGWLRGF